MYLEFQGGELKLVGNITLTKSLFVALIGTFIMALLFGAYSEFSIINNSSIEEPYKSAFENISNEYGNFGSLAGTASDQGFVKNILDFGKNVITGTVNVFVVGLEAIGSFFAMIPLIGDILSTLKNVFPGLDALIGLITILIGLYLAMRYIQSVSNKPDLP